MKVEIDRPIRTGFLIGLGASLAGALITTVLTLFGMVVWSMPSDSDDGPGSPFLLFALLILSALSIAVVRTKPDPATTKLPASE